MLDEILETSSDCEIISTRTFNYPIELLFRSWSEPEHLKVWWGPAGFSNTFNEFDFKVGGKWDFIMHGPEQGHYHNTCEFIKIERPNLIAWKRHSKPIFQVVAEFIPVSDSQTKLIFNMKFPDAEDCRKIRPFAVEKNEENFDRLEDVLRLMN